MNSGFISSAKPSMLPSIVLETPRLLTMNRGSIPRTISVEKSVKKLTSPNAKTFRIPPDDDLFSSVGDWLGSINFST